MSKWLIDIHGELEGDYELICKAGSTIPLDKVKQAREEMYEASHADADGWETVIDLEKAFEILDKLIEMESEE